MDIIPIPTPGATETEVQGIVDAAESSINANVDAAESSINANVDAAESSILSATVKPWYERNPGSWYYTSNPQVSATVGLTLMYTVPAGRKALLQSFVWSSRCVTAPTSGTYYNLQYYVRNPADGNIFAVRHGIGDVIVVDKTFRTTDTPQFFMLAGYTLKYAIDMDMLNGAWNNYMNVNIVLFDE